MGNLSLGTVLMKGTCVIEGCELLSTCRSMCPRHYRSWRRSGGLFKADGPISNDQGYLYISGRPLHIEKAEKALGKSLPAGVIVHHVDYDKANNEGNNLVICPSISYHRLIHRRTDAYNACGNANHHRCAICSNYDSTDNMKIHYNGPNGTQYVHKQCRADYDKSKALTKEEK